MMKNFSSTINCLACVPLYGELATHRIYSGLIALSTPVVYHPYTIQRLLHLSFVPKFTKIDGVIIIAITPKAVI